MDSRRLMFVVLGVLFVFGLALSIAEAWDARDWRVALFNLGPEFVGAVVTYVLFDQYIERRAKSEKERKAGRRKLRDEKARLRAEMGSSVKGVAVAAADKLRQRGWLVDGSLQRTDLESADLQAANLANANLQESNLKGANLQGANLMHANLQGASLMSANLQGADLIWVNLKGAHLGLANLQGAILGWGEFDGTTTLPDFSSWTPYTDLARFTDPDHPEFWRSDAPH